MMVPSFFTGYRKLSRFDVLRFAQLGDSKKTKGNASESMPTPTDVVINRQRHLLYAIDDRERAAVPSPGLCTRTQRNAILKKKNTD